MGLIITKESSHRTKQVAIAVGVPAMRLWNFGKISPMELVRAIAAMVRKSAYLIRSRTRDEKLHREAEALKEF